MRKEGDSTSDHSGEITPSDSGRGGSEDDLNNSILLSHSSSVDFGKRTASHLFLHVKCQAIVLKPTNNTAGNVS